MFGDLGSYKPEELAAKWNRRDDGGLEGRETVKPCPFCGERPVTIENINPYGIKSTPSEHFYIMWCDQCRMSKAIDSQATRKQMIDNWNVRTATHEGQSEFNFTGDGTDAVPTMKGVNYDGI
jgi:Lar family restriction alleviation protein